MQKANKKYTVFVQKPDNWSQAAKSQQANIEQAYVEIIILDLDG